MNKIDICEKNKIVLFLTIKFKKKKKKFLI